MPLEADLLSVRFFAIATLKGLLAVMLSKVVEEVCALLEGLVAPFKLAGEDQNLLATDWVKFSRCFVPLVWNPLELLLPDTVVPNFIWICRL